MAQLGLLDNVGAPVIDNIFGLIVDTPANLALVEAIATSPAFLAINSAQAGVSQILGPFERALLVCALIFFLCCFFHCDSSIIGEFRVQSSYVNDSMAHYTGDSSFYGYCSSAPLCSEGWSQGVHASRLEYNS